MRAYNGLYEGGRRVSDTLINGNIDWNKFYVHSFYWWRTNKLDSHRCFGYCMATCNYETCFRMVYIIHIIGMSMLVTGRRERSKESEIDILPHRG